MTTNFENLISLNEREMAHFLMAYSDSCRTCIYKTFHTNERGAKFLDGWPCKGIENKMSCLKATEAWLARETEADEDDMFMFHASRNNVKVEDYNKSLMEGE